eukprot:6360641-Alexandrium_andersonii.AAC.1
MSVKVQCMSTLIFTRLTYNAGTWAVLSSAEAARFHSGVMYMWRALLPRVKRQSMRDSEVLAELGAWPPYAFIVAARMKLFRRFWAVAPEVTRSLVVWAAGDPS